MKFMTKMAAETAAETAEKIGGLRDLLVPAALAVGTAGSLGAGVGAGLDEAGSSAMHTQRVRDDRAVRGSLNRVNEALRDRYDRDVAPKLDQGLQRRLGQDKRFQHLRDVLDPQFDDLIQFHRGGSSGELLPRRPGITPATRAANVRLDALRAGHHPIPSIPMHPFTTRR